MGYVHSIETCGTVDGPGIRFVVFLAGCPLRCLYCSNPDCRHFEDGQLMSVDALTEEIEKYVSYMQASGGGVTISGGEPLYQAHFTQALLQRCHELNIHTALDTSGYCDLNVAKPVLAYTDLVLLDIKSFDRDLYRRVTSVELEPTLAIARYLEEIDKPTWIRFVLVPGLTDDRRNMEQLADFVATLKNVERVEILPFHKMGEYKWEQLGYDYTLKDTLPPTPEQIKGAIEIFQGRGLMVV